MYPSSSSSLLQNPLGPRPSMIGLTHYDSTPSSLLNSIVDSVIGTAADLDFSSLRSSESTFKVNSSNDGYRDASTTKPLLRSYGLNKVVSSNSSSCFSLASFPNHLTYSQISCLWMASPFSEY
ncbi:transcription factor bHLH128 [Pyrus ussuriensis x Pyrus communis]|uniref:Transcription factor bHLH128 n=1 Tax=Pyrus ussuriensis x Pyrus communis TaxID=2448454 RepID=A0A5N5FGH4_9ROSA|nr:transcription factor bHLH128 [Pyrus ussuriensis x Pyrus communis]